MDKEFLLELFGYLGSALIILSFAMRNIKWLRVVNITGSFISVIYSICVGAMPVVVLNGSLILINSIQLMRIFRSEKENAPAVNNETEAA